MIRPVTRTLAILAVVTLAACNTVHGLGTDLGNAGDAIASASR